ncbi:MAG: glycosyltransferase family 39 protein, partial [Clostridium baratii]
MNLSIVFLAVWIMYLFIKNVGLQRATLFSILSILITPFYTYTTIVYTDTLGMILPILSLYLYAKIYRSPKKEIGLLVTLGLVLGLGGLLKTHALVVLVAILIHYFLTRKDGFIRLSAPLILMVLVTMMSYK